MTSADELLLACLNWDLGALDRLPASSVSPEAWRDLFAFAGRHHVQPLVLRRLARADVGDLLPEGAFDELQRTCHDIARRNLALHAEVRRLVDALSSEHIPVILLKGAHVATELYANVALREMADIDLMVPRDRLEHATLALQGLGYRANAPFSVADDVTISQHVTILFKPPFYAVELHWNVTEPSKRHTIDPAGLWERRQPVRDSAAWGLSSEDLVLHLAVHLSYAHQFEGCLRSLCDLSELLGTRAHELRWNQILDRAAAWGWLPGIRLTLELVRSLMGAPVPQTVCAQLTLDGVAPTLCSAAALQLLQDPASAATLQVRLSMVDATLGVRENMRRLLAILGPPRGIRRRHYPSVPDSAWTQWLVYLLRGRDLARRHLGTLIRLFIRREPHLVKTANRQRQLRAYLMG